MPGFVPVRHRVNALRRQHCSACGWRKPSLTLAERTFTCEACGLVIDRDINAARNLLDLAASGAERLNACGAQVRPGVAGHRVTKQEPGAAHADKTGTAGWQRLAAGRSLLMPTDPQR